MPHDPELPAGAVIINNCAGCDRRFRSLYSGIDTISFWEVADSIEGIRLPDYGGIIMSVHEEISKRMWAALVLIILSSAALSFEGASSLKFSAGSLMVLGAAVCWGLENNCTRMISSRSTYEIVILKGIFSGTGSLIIALAVGETLPSPLIIAAALVLGFISYGLSIFAYIRAQNIIGAAKTSAFYAAAPFIGALFSLVFLHEGLSQMFVIGLVIMFTKCFVPVK